MGMKTIWFLLIVYVAAHDSEDDANYDTDDSDENVFKIDDESETLVNEGFARKFPDISKLLAIDEVECTETELDFGKPKFNKAFEDIESHVGALAEAYIEALKSLTHIDKKLKDDSIKIIEDIKRQLRLYICYTFSYYYNEKDEVPEDIGVIEKFFKTQIGIYGIRAGVNYIPLHFPHVTFEEDHKIEGAQAKIPMKIKSMRQIKPKDEFLSVDSRPFREAYCDDFRVQLQLISSIMENTLTEKYLTKHEKDAIRNKIFSIRAELQSLASAICTPINDTSPQGDHDTFGQFVASVKTKFTKDEISWNAKAKDEFNKLKDIFLGVFYPSKAICEEMYGLDESKSKENIHEQYKKKIMELIKKYLTEGFEDFFGKFRNLSERIETLNNFGQNIFHTIMKDIEKMATQIIDAMWAQYKEKNVFKQNFRKICPSIFEHAFTGTRQFLKYHEMRCNQLGINPDWLHSSGTPNVQYFQPIITQEPILAALHKHIKDKDDGEIQCEWLKFIINDLESTLLEITRYQLWLLKDEKEDKLFKSEILIELIKKKITDILSSFHCGKEGLTGEDMIAIQLLELECFNYINEYSILNFKKLSGSADFDYLKPVFRQQQDAVHTEIRNVLIKLGTFSGVLQNSMHNHIVPKRMLGYIEERCTETDLVIIDPNILSLIHKAEKYLRYYLPIYVDLIRTSTDINETKKNKVINDLLGVVNNLRIQLCDERRIYSMIVKPKFERLEAEARLQFGAILLKADVAFLNLRFPKIELTRLIQSYGGPITNIESDKRLEVTFKRMFTDTEIITFRADDLEKISEGYVSDLKYQFAFIVKTIVLPAVENSKLTKPKKVKAKNDLRLIKSKLLPFISRIIGIGGIAKKTFKSFSDLIDSLKLHFKGIVDDVNRETRTLFKEIKDIYIEAVQPSGGYCKQIIQYLDDILQKNPKIDDKDFYSEIEAIIQNLLKEITSDAETNIDSNNDNSIEWQKYFRSILSKFTKTPIDDSIDEEPEIERPNIAPNKENINEAPQLEEPFNRAKFIEKMKDRKLNKERVKGNKLAFMRAVAKPLLDKRVHECNERAKKTLRDIIKEQTELIKDRIKFIWDNLHGSTPRAKPFMDKHFSQEQCVDIFEDIHLAIKHLTNSHIGELEALIRLVIYSEKTKEWQLKYDANKGIVITMDDIIPMSEELFYRPVKIPFISSHLLKITTKGHSERASEFNNIIEQNVNDILASFLRPINSIKKSMENLFSTKAKTHSTVFIDDSKTPTDARFSPNILKRALASSPEPMDPEEEFGPGPSTKKRKITDQVDSAVDMPDIADDEIQNSKRMSASTRKSSSHSEIVPIPILKKRPSFEIKRQNSIEMRSIRGFALHTAIIDQIEKTVKQNIKKLLAKFTLIGGFPKDNDVQYSQNILDQFVRDNELYLMEQVTELQRRYSNLS